MYGVLAVIGSTSSVRGAVGLFGDDLAHPTAERNPWDTGPSNLWRFQTHLLKRSAQGCSNPDLDLPQRMRVLVDRFPSCFGLGRLSCEAAQDQRCHADVVSMLENLFVDLKLGLQLAICRLGRIPSTPRPLCICHFVTNLGPSQPLLVYRYWSVVRMMSVYMDICGNFYCFCIIWFKPWTPPPAHTPYHFCLLFPARAFVSVLCTACSLWYVEFVPNWALLIRVLTVIVSVQGPTRGPPGFPGQDLPQVPPASPCEFPKTEFPATI